MYAHQVLYVSKSEPNYAAHASFPELHAFLRVSPLAPFATKYNHSERIDYVSTAPNPNPCTMRGVLEAK